MSSVKLNVDEIIKLDTIKYKRLNDREERDEDEEEILGNGQSLLDDDDKIPILDEEDLTVLHGKDFSWFRRSVHFLLFFIGVAALLLLVLLVLPRRYSNANFENGFGVRIPIDLRRLEASATAKKWIEELVGNSADHQTLPPKYPRFIHPVETKHLQCSQYFQPKAKFDDYKKKRITYKDPEDEKALPMDCKSIRSRSYFQTENLYPEEQQFPISYARAVFKDYRFLEMELSATYAPHNFYCYALDSKASPLFHKRMRALASCFSNIYLTQHEFHMDSAGHNITYSHHECMNQLAKPSFSWKYMVLLQNHDITLKTNEELIQVYKWFNGTNDISAKVNVWERINKQANWTFEALHLFRNESRNLNLHNGFAPQMRFAASLVQVSISRAMVDFMIYELDMTQLMKNIEWKAYGIDEVIMGSLNAADAVDVPGGFTEYCLDHKVIESSMTRLTYWTGSSKSCESGMLRHGICIFGMEYMRDLAETDYLIGNKIQPDRDFGAIACWHEMMFNRTHLDRGIQRLKSQVYLNLPHVRFNRERNQQGKKFDRTKFNCSEPALYGLRP